MTIEIAIQLLVNGILLGGIYGILSVGLTMIFGVLRVINFAHGDFIMLAMYAAYWLAFVSPSDISAVFLVVPAFFVLGLLVAKYLINPIIDDPELSQVFTTMGLGIVLQNSALILWQADPRTKTLVGPALKLGFLMISYPRFRAFLITGVVIILLSLFLKFTYLGKAIRASSLNRNAAAMVGVNLSRIYAVAFGIGISMAAISGVLLLPVYAAYPMIGFQFVILCFVVVILGGLGSIPGALVGGLIIGIIESFTGFFIDPSLKSVVYFIIFMLVLLFRPRGLWGSLYTA
jgi:branched-chain amino acid transport system permease protein